MGNRRHPRPDRSAVRIPGQYRHFLPSLGEPDQREATIFRLTGAVLAVIASLVLVAGSAVAGVTRSAAARPAAAGARPRDHRITFQEWLYPGPAGSPTCLAPREFTDGRVRHGVLKPEYMDVNNSGRLYLRPAGQRADACNGYSPRNAAEVRKWSTRQYMTISLDTLHQEEALTSSPAKVAAAVRRLASFVKSIHFTGVDVDFENYWSWKGPDAARYYAFLRKLALGLHAAGLRLQVDGPADFNTPFNYGRALATGADQVIVMAYDDEFGWPPSTTCKAITPLKWLRSVVTSALGEIPRTQRNRLVVGLPSYGYVASDRCQDITSNMSFDQMRREPGFSSKPSVIASRRGSGSLEIRWSSHGKFFDYVDQKSMDAKLAVVEKLGIRNVSVWVLGGDNPWFSARALRGAR
jgi:Glycosyl hydrolases family 18